mgnify:CR=1 FL=1
MTKPPIRSFKSHMLLCAAAGIALSAIQSSSALAQAQSDMDGVMQRLAEAYPEANRGHGAALVPLKERWVGGVGPILWMLLGAVGFVLLIACANVANLLLARSAARQKEMAIRSALGAQRGRIIRQLLTEASILALIGGLLGAMVAQWGVDALLAAIPENQLNAMPYLKGVTVDWRVLGFTFALSLVTGVAFGLAPALAATRIDLLPTLRDEGLQPIDHRRLTSKNALIVFQVAISVLLLGGTSMFLQLLAATRALAALNGGATATRPARPAREC